MKSQRYYVRFTAANGRSTLESYPTARRAKEVVRITLTRHAAAQTSAQYLGRSVTRKD